MLTLQSVHTATVVGLFVCAALSALILVFISAPYGRHAREGWGPTLPTRAVWVLMESPAVIAFTAAFFGSGGEPGAVGWILLGVWLFHYVYRSFIYPFRMRVRPGQREPLLIPLMALVFNSANGFVNGVVASGALYAWPEDWWTDPRFAIGLSIFAIGTAINRHADHVLRNLRKPGETGYRIPYGGLYEYISCPNYMGELIAWAGWAIATWSLAGLSFFVYTAANLVPRALENHGWYQERFDDYPPQRRALIPFLL